MANPTFYIHGNIGAKDAGINLPGIAPNISASDVNAFLQANLEAEAVTINITSDGGDVAEGLAIYDAICAFPGKVTTITNRANSIASVIFLAGSERLVTDPAQFVVHNAWFSPEGLSDLMLNTQTLSQLKEEVEAVDKVLRAIYAKYTDADMEALMAKETNITTEQLIQMGLATGKAVSVEMNAHAGRSVAYTMNYLKILNQSKNKQMEDVNKRLEGLERLFKGFSNLFKGNTKNMVVTAEGGTSLYVYSESGELEGSKVVIADADGNPTEEAAPDGAHTLSTGETITVSEGVITGVQVAESIEDLKAEMAEKEEAYKAEMAEKEEEVNNLKNALNAIKNEFDALKKAIPGKPAPQAQVETEKVDWEKMSPSQKILLNKKIELKNGK
jgi:ATP-dependent protease ClpP protease subunit